MEFIKEYKIWNEHELLRNPLFKSIPVTERDSVWNEIVDKYLQKFNLIVRMDFDWGSSGLCNPPFPGSYQTGPMFPAEYFKELPLTVLNKLEKWVKYRDMHSLASPTFDFDRSQKEGHQIALEIGRYLPNDIYFEFNSSFRRIRKDGNNVIEEELPDFIKKWQ